MASARSRTRSNCVISFSAVALCTVLASAAAAQATPDFFTKVETLTLSDGTPAAGRVSLSGDTAVVGADDVVHVFERESGGDHWVHSATLVASDGRSGFGTSVATDGITIVVGAGFSGVAYVFQRIPGSQAWRETARLSGDTNDSSFGATVAVSGTTVVVGAPGASFFGSAGHVHVFEQDGEEPDAWNEIAKLAGEPPPEGINSDFFGTGIDVEGDLLVVTASRPANPRNGGGLVVYVFSRIHDGSTAWTLAARLPVVAPVDIPGPGSVDLSGDTIVAELVGSGFVPLAVVFQQNRETNEWDEITRFSSWETRISGDLMVAALQSSLPTRVYARNQNGAGLWGEVARLQPPTPFPTAQNSIVAISNDTILSGFRITSSTSSPIEVYVADTDRDGLRDGIDACPRDPLNNVEGGCARNRAAYLVLDDLITLGEVTAETQGNELHVTATFTNTSASAIANPFFEVIELTGSNVLVNADAGPGATGATLSPDVGDGILSPGESTTVTFVIGLETHEPFRFFVSVRGEVGP